MDIRVVYSLEAIMNKASINTYLQIFVWAYAFIFLK